MFLNEVYLNMVDEIIRMGMQKDYIGCVGKVCQNFVCIALEGRLTVFQKELRCTWPQLQDWLLVMLHATLHLSLCRVNYLQMEL